jgi:hypothetical protein
VALDATDMGAPLYRSRGFCDVLTIDRWLGPINPIADDPAVAVTAIDRAALPEVMAFDHRETGTARTKLLESLWTADGGLALACRRQGRLSGYALVRPGREHRYLGPCVTHDLESFRALVNAVRERFPGATLLLDAPRSERRAIALREVGLSRQRTLMRMTLHQPSFPLCRPAIVAAAGFEWG